MIDYQDRYVAECLDRGVTPTFSGFQNFIKRIKGGALWSLSPPRRGRGLKHGKKEAV